MWFTIISACSMAGTWEVEQRQTVTGTVPDPPPEEIVDAARPPAVGELVVNEIMDDPDPTPDETGEWFELVNVGDATLDLMGVEVQDDGEESTALSGALSPGAWLLVAASDDPEENGGIVPDLVFDSDEFHLGNDEDEVIVVLDDVTIDAVAYDGDFPARKGRSRALDPGKRDDVDNDDADAWCDGVGNYGSDANEGTPGEGNDDCP